METIVIAKYNEDTTWTTKLQKPDTNCIVYSKGPHSHPLEINLPNVGRESHTYVYHIVNNYETLANVTVFLQGNPFDHLPGGGIDQLLKEASSHPSGLSQNALVHDVGCNNAYYGFTIHNHMGCKVSPFLNNQPFGIWLKQTCNIAYQKSPRWYIGACFAATRRAIQSVPLETWKVILKSLEYDANPVTGHYMERSWYMLMDLEKEHLFKLKHVL